MNSNMNSDVNSNMNSDVNSNMNSNVNSVHKIFCEKMCLVE